MHVLALDTTTRAGSVAIVAGEPVENDQRVLFEESGDARRSHAERLPTDLLRALDYCGLTIAQIDAFAIASGPGSFTGLRIGIATMQGLASAQHARVVPISALTALAEAASAGLEPGALVGAWMDAHRHDVFSALFRVGDAPPFAIHRLQEVDGPAVGDPAATLGRWRAMDMHPVAIAGDGAVLYADLVRTQARILPPPPLAGIMGHMALVRARAGLGVPPAGVQPLYVRRPDAEVARDSLAR